MGHLTGDDRVPWIQPPNIPSLLILINDARGSRVRIFGCIGYLNGSRKR